MQSNHMILGNENMLQLMNCMRNKKLNFNIIKDSSKDGAN